MQKYTRLLLLLGLTLLLSYCEGGGGRGDYRNEMGANGLLTPRALFARYVDALGGEAALRAHQSKRLYGTFDLSAFGISGDMTMLAAPPNLVRQNIVLGAMGEIDSGYNGEVGWTSDPLSGMNRLQGKALNDVLRQSEYFLPLTFASVYPRQETVERTEVNGQDAYEVRLYDSDGGESSFFFAADSGLMIRTIAVVASPLGDARTVTDISGYQEYDGEMSPTRLTVNQAGQVINIQLDTISFNDVEPSEFTPPAGI